MNKLSKREYIMLIADAINSVRKIEDNADIKMARVVLNDLKEFLYFRSSSKDDLEKFNEWKRTRKDKC